MWRTRLVPLTIIAAISLTGCGRLLAPVGQAFDNQSAQDVLRDDAEREGWTQVEFLQSEGNGRNSFVFAAYMDKMTFENGFEEPAECWAMSARQPSADGSTGGGSGSCTLASAEVVGDADWSWMSDDPSRILGTVPLDATKVEVIFLDGSKELLEPLYAEGSFRRAFLSQRLSQRVDQIKAIDVVRPSS